MSNFTEDFNHLMDDFSKAELGNELRQVETVTEGLLSRIENAVSTCQDPKKKKALQDTAAKTLIPYCNMGGSRSLLTKDMRQSLSKIYETDNLVFVNANKEYQDALAKPKSSWQEDFGHLKDHAIWGYIPFPKDFENKTDGSYDLDGLCGGLFEQLQQNRQGCRTANDIERVTALTVKAAELYLQKSGKSADEMPDNIKKTIVDILGKDAKIVSNTPDKKMKFDLSACITKEPKAPKKEKAPSLWSRIKKGAAKIWDKPAVKAAAYTALAVGFGAATAGLFTATASIAAGSFWASHSAGAIILAGVPATTATIAAAVGCAKSLYAAGKKIKQAITYKEDLKKEKFAKKRDQTISSFRENVKKMQNEGNMAASVFEIIKLDKQLKSLTLEENKERGLSDPHSMRGTEYAWIKSAYPEEFHSVLSTTLRLSRLNEPESNIKKQTAPMMEQAKTAYTERKEKETGKQKQQTQSRNSNIPQPRVIINPNTH